MKIVAFNSSPRGERGNTHIMVEAFLAGAKEAGADVENILLAHKKIEHCRGCFACWTDTPGVCVIRDDMADLIPRLFKADIAVFATPLYVDNVSGIMKAFLDRLIPAGDPHFTKDANGETCHVERFSRVPRLVIISNCGYPEQTHFQVLHHYFERVARNFHTEVIAEIYRGEGELLGVDSLILKPLIWNYKRILKRAGGEVVKNLKLSDDTIKKLERPLVPYDKYIEEGNKHWDKRLSKGCRFHRPGRTLR